MLSHAICQSIRRILASDTEDPAWSHRAVQQFDELRDEHPWVLSQQPIILTDDTRVRLLTRGALSREQLESLEGLP